MKWIVRYRRSVEKDIERLPKRMKAAVIDSLLDLEKDAFPVGHERIKPSKTRFALRMGDYRIVYSVVKEAGVVEVEFVGHRRDAYRWF